MSKMKLTEAYGFFVPTKWGAEMVRLLENLAPTFKINIEKEIELPYPMVDGKDKLEPGEYDVELAADKENYVWTNPLTQERVAFPIDSIKETEPEADPNAPADPNAAPPPADPNAVPAAPGADPMDALFGAPPATV